MPNHPLPLFRISSLHQPDNTRPLPMFAGRTTRRLLSRLLAVASANDSIDDSHTAVLLDLHERLRVIARH
jgi:hypothetical protein